MWVFWTGTCSQRKWLSCRITPHRVNSFFPSGEKDNQISPVFPSSPGLCNFLRPFLRTILILGSICQRESFLLLLPVGSRTDPSSEIKRICLTLNGPYDQLLFAGSDNPHSKFVQLVWSCLRLTIPFHFWYDAPLSIHMMSSDRVGFVGGQR